MLYNRLLGIGNTYVLGEGSHCNVLPKDQYLEFGLVGHLEFC